MIAPISPESDRDNAMTHFLVDVQTAAKNWAMNSQDGASVWNIANEFRELWHDWGVALIRPAWCVPNFVVYALDIVATETADPAVRISVEFARQAILSYNE